VRPVNLVPPEDRRGDHAPLRAGVASYAIVGVLALALVGVVLMVLAGNDISDSEAELAALEVRAAQADFAAAELAPYEQFASLEEARSATISSLARSRFDWERVLNELALVIPPQVALENLVASVGTGAAAPTTGAPTGAPSEVTGPSLQLTGCTEGQQGTARLLAALRDIDGVTRVGMQSSALGDAQDEAAEAAPVGEGGAAPACVPGKNTAMFEITVAFDAVPTPDMGAVPPAGTAPVAATEDGGVAEAGAEAQAAEESAAEQSAEASSVADAVGVGN
jgi:Tfp pilus assembly protein PilN